MNLIEMELERRKKKAKSKVRGYNPKRQPVLEARPPKIENVAVKKATKSRFSLSKLTKSASRTLQSLDEAHDSIQAWRLKKRKQEQALYKARVKKKVKKVKDTNPWRN